MIYMTEFEEQMRGYCSQFGGQDLQFSPQGNGFELGSFNLPNSIVIWLISELFQTVIVDWRDRSSLLPNTKEEWMWAIKGQFEKGSFVLVPVERSYVGEFIWYGVAEIIQGRLLAVVVSNGKVAQQVADAFKSTN